MNCIFSQSGCHFHLSRSTGIKHRTILKLFLDKYFLRPYYIQSTMICFSEIAFNYLTQANHNYVQFSIQIKEKLNFNITIFSCLDFFLFPITFLIGKFKYISYISRSDRVNRLWINTSYIFNCLKLGVASVSVIFADWYLISP